MVRGSPAVLRLLIIDKNRFAIIFENQIPTIGTENQSNIHPGFDGLLLTTAHLFDFKKYQRRPLKCDM